MTKMFFDLEDLANEPSLEDVRGILKPHIKYDFRLNLRGNLLGGVRLDNVNAIDRPSAEFEEIHHGDEVYAGKMTWLPITVSFTEERDSPAMKKLMEQVYQSPTDAFTTHIVMNTDKGIQEVWVLEDCCITNLNYSAVEHSTCADLAVELTIAYCNAYML